MPRTGEHAIRTIGQDIRRNRTIGQTWRRFGQSMHWTFPGLRSPMSATRRATGRLLWATAQFDRQVRRL